MSIKKYQVFFTETLRVKRRRSVYASTIEEAIDLAAEGYHTAEDLVEEKSVDIGDWKAMEEDE